VVHRRSRSIALGTAVAALALTLAGCGSSSDSGGGALGQHTASSGGPEKTYKIGLEAPLSGDNQQLGINIENAAELAVKQANAANLGFKLELVPSDDLGDPSKAPAAAAALIMDSSVVAVVGPVFSGPTSATGKAYGAAGMGLVSPSASNAELTSSGFTTFHRIIPTDGVEGTQAAEWLAKKFKNVYVVDDTQVYGKGVADVVAKVLGSKGVKVERQGVPPTTSDYGSIAQTVVSSGAQALFYGGYDAQAASFAKALNAAGFKGLTMTGNGGKSTVFTRDAGTAGYGWFFSCGCQDATAAPQSQDFTSAYKAAFHTDPSTYSPEGFDATNVIIEAIKAAASQGTVTRQSVEAAINATDYKGITTDIQFQSNGEVKQATVNLYTDKNGQIVQLGNIKDQK